MGNNDILKTTILFLGFRSRCTQ